MKDKFPSVSVIVPTRNSATTVLFTLNSICKQKYPVKEIIVVDNASTDTSVSAVKNFSKKSKIPILLIQRKKNMGVGSSYNAGVKIAKSDLLIFLHSDSSLETDNQIQILVAPLIHDASVVAAYPTAYVPMEVWKSYNFWQKYRFSRLVGKEVGFNGKFDCIRRKAFLKVGGFDEVRFARDEAIGGEDADLFLRLQKIGKLVLSKAVVIHLHYLGSDYSLLDHIKTRKMLARTYGRLIREHGTELPLSSKGTGLNIHLGTLLFFIKPTLAILPLIPHIFFFGICILVIYSFLNSRTLYLSSLTILNPRILLLPFLDIFLVYYESFWMFNTLLIKKKGNN